jgi:agmatine/peptidylarginine deiminase
MSKHSIYLSHHLQTGYTVVYEELCKALEKSGVNHYLLPYSNDIWARDFMPVHVGGGEYLGYVYRPDYLYDNVSEREYITNQKLATGDIPINYIEKLDAIIDGGNFVFCDDKMIMTDKIFSENPNIKQSKLINKLEEVCQKELILIPWDMDEEYGHADGMVSYIGNGKLLLNNYCQMGKDGVGFSKRLHKILNPHFTVTELHYSSPWEEMNAAYINYIETESSVIIPALSTKHDSASDIAALETFKKIFKKEILQVYAQPLIKDGGALHCVTWDFFQEETEVATAEHNNK